MICNKCNKEILDTAKFCPKCGAKVTDTVDVILDAVPESQVKTCPVCEAENSLSAKFCRVDGHVLSSVEHQKEPQQESEQSSEGPLCPVCGTGNSPNAKFCKKDGTPLAPKSVSAEPTAAIKETLQEPSPAHIFSPIYDLNSTYQ